MRAVQSANILIKQMKASPDQRIPELLLKETRCIIVIPEVVKIGVGISVERGKGLASCRHEDTGEWGAPAFYNVSGITIGLQLGGGSADVIVLVMDQNGVNGILSGGIVLGSAQAAAIAGKTGSISSAGTMKTSYITYAKPIEGLFAGADFGGVSIKFNKDGNNKAYGETLTPIETLFNRKDIPAQLKIFHEELVKFTP